MKLRYTPATGSALVLGDDDAGLVIGPFQPGQKRSVQAVDYFRGTHRVYIPRGNAENVRSFTVERLHANESAALLFLRDHPEELPNEGVLEITQNGSRIYHDAVLDSVACVRHDGKTTVWQYVFACGAGRQKP